jgi:ATP-binding cassette subfamily B protein/subfamily B ATP-binding cassette protein MsbA
MSPIRRILRYLRPYRVGFDLALVLLGLQILFEIAKPWPLKVIVDRVLGAETLGRSWLDSVEKPQLLLIACVAIIVIQVTLSAITLLYNALTIGIGQRMVSDLRADMLTHLYGQSLGFFGQRPGTDLAYRVTFDTYAVQSLAINGFMPLLSAGVLVVVMGFVMLRMNPALAAIFFAVGPLLFLVTRLISGRIARISTEMSQRESRLLEEAQRDVDAIQVVKAFTAEANERAQVMRASARALAAAFRLYFVQTGYAGAVSVLLALGTAGVLYAGGLFALAGTVTVGDLLVFVSYLAALQAPVDSVSRALSVVHESSAGARRVVEVLDSEPDVRDMRRAQDLRSVEGALRFETVSFTYPNQTDSLALENIDFEAEPGSLVALVGPSGAGKSTLVSLIPRFFDPTAGRVLLDGTDLRRIRLQSLRNQIGFVPQSPLLFPLSLADNIRYGRPEASDEDVRRAADLVGVTGFAERLPKGFETFVDAGGHALSHGEAQRVTIARALVRNPRILILDEPTSALDAETEALVVAGLERARVGRTTLVIAHRLSTIQRADHLLVLDRGRLVERGTFASLRDAGGLFARLHQHMLFSRET